MSTIEQNNTNFPLFIKQQIENIDKIYDENNEFLQNFQYIVREYLINTPLRGILIFHSPGQGKSITAASIADYYRKYDPSRKIIILLSKSLQSNFVNNIKKYMKNNPNNTNSEKNKNFIENTIEDKYNFISLNSSNMYEQISQIKRSKSEIEFEKKIGKFNDSISSHFLENTLLIIDEFHNLSNSITNKSKNAIKLYNTIMKTKNIKLVFLTGTPIINHPFELVPTFNLLKGYIYDKKNKFTLFPEDKDEFIKYFIDLKTSSIKNKNKFQNRIFGMVSYYGDFYFDRNINFPEQKKIIVEEIKMSLYQFSRYQEIRDYELKEESNKFKKKSSVEGFIFSDVNDKTISSYRIRSRQASNFLIPDYALKFTSSRINVKKYINLIKEEDLENLDKFSPKFKKIIENINRHKDQIGFVYSEFISGEGLYLFAKVLEINENYIYWEKSEKFHNKINEYDLLNLTEAEDVEENKQDIDYNGGFELDFYDNIFGGISSAEKNAKSSKAAEKNAKSSKAAEKNAKSIQKTYAFITGDISFVDRQNILNLFNSNSNINGEIISLLLISKTGAEGLNLKNVRHIHIMEPFWNYARIEQIIARGVRFQSHINLPEQERNVQPYIYISTYPNNYNKQLIKERTTDEELLHNSIEGKKIRNEFELALIESSFDCSFNYSNLEKHIQEKFKCKLCAPTGNNLYLYDIRKDIYSVDNCKSLEEKKTLKAKEIIVNINGEDEKFYYIDEPDIKIFAFDKDINAYIPLKISSPFYGEITRKILNID